jgi:hypothetical protein
MEKGKDRMRLALIAHHQTVALEAAGATPPRDRTSRSNKALEHCKDEWTHAYELAQAKGLTANKALRMASVAYKLAMPKMDSLPTIRAAIACIAQGITLEVFDGRDGSQLLYAAQVALSVLNQKGAKK